MAHFVVLANFTEQGAKAVGETVKRADKYREMAAKAGVTINSMLWTLGCHDVIVHAEAEDEAAMTALTLSLVSRGFVCSQTLRAFDAAEMKAIIAKMQ